MCVCNKKIYSLHVILRNLNYNVLDPIGKVKREKNCKYSNLGHKHDTLSY